ncbi:MAG: hypothetical protein U0350_33690 [Caldilineaceae bacterium]
MAERKEEPRRQIDPIFKQVMVNEFTGYQAALQTEVEVSRLPRTIDVLITVDAQEALQRVRTETSFSYFLRCNQVEFKGREDPLTNAGFHLINGRTQLYLGEQGVTVHEMTVTIICASKPRSVFAYTGQFQPFHSIEAGYYKNEDHPAVHLIVINELPIIPKHYPLLLFASSERKFRQFLEQLLAQGDITYLRYAYEVRPKLTKEVFTMAGLSATLSQEDLKFMAQDVGRELMAFLPPEERLAGISIDELLQAINAGVLLQELTPEHRTMLLELLKLQAAALQEKKKRNSNAAPH